MKKIIINENSKIALKNISGAFVIRGAGVIISLFTTPAFIAYFDNDVILGVWYTILSVLSWFLNFDFGIGNGVRNNLTVSIANGDDVKTKKIISSGLFINFILSAIFFGLGGVLIYQIDLNWIYGVSHVDISSSILQQATLITFAGIILRFFLSTISSIWYSLQKSYINNLLSLFTSIGQLLFVLLYTPINVEEGLVSLSVSYVIMSNAPILVSALILFSTKLRYCRPRVRYIKREAIRDVLGIGLVFFACQILYVLIMNSNEILISNLYGAEYTTHYSFYNKLTNVISLFITLAMTPLWSLITKATNEKQYTWLKKTFKLCSIIGLLTIVIQFAFIPFEQWVMDLWLKNEAIDINWITALAFACFGSVFVYQNILSTFCCGFGRMKLQLVFYAVGIVLKFLIVSIFRDFFGDWSLIVWTNVIILLPYCVVQHIALYRYLNKLEKGIN